MIPVGSSNSINGTESLIVEVLYPEANGISQGAVRFSGFNEVGMMIFGNAYPDDSISGSASVDVNGSTLSSTLDGSTNGYASTQPSLALAPPESMLTIDNTIVLLQVLPP